MTSVPNRRVLRKMGFLADQEGIIKRYLREKGGWDSHLLRCREYILKKVKEQKCSDITILGSGWLLDVPLEELSELTGVINLMDINHPSQILKRVKALNNVNIIYGDITGGVIGNVWKEVKKKPATLDEIEVPDYNFEFEPGLIISLNILTQTDTLLNDYLVKKTDLDIEEYRRFRKRVQASHLNMLSSYPNLIITDYKEEIMDIYNGRVIKTNPLIFADGLPAGKEREEWDWVFDSSGEYYRRKRVVFKVMAIDNSEK